jgi:hypothetical protein
MATKLAIALLGSARATRSLLKPRPSTLDNPDDAPGAPLSQEVEARIEAAIDETLEYHRTHRPPNTARNYAPKQKEWTVSPYP